MNTCSISLSNARAPPDNSENRPHLIRMLPRSHPLSANAAADIPSARQSGGGGNGMSGRHHWTMRRLVVAMLMVHALSLAGLSPSHAAAANSSAGEALACSKQRQDCA
jgi:hypothetical protein